MDPRRGPGRRTMLPLAAAMILVATPRVVASETAVVQGTAKAADGVSIAYDVRGTGETALVFIHCWSCDRTFWKGQVDAFAADYRVVALDLGGHGASGRDRQTWTIPGLAGDVQAVVEALDLKRAILVGHSMGGPVALEAARRMPQRVVGVVLVDTIHNAETAPPPELFDQIGARLQSDFKGTMAEFIHSMFPQGADPAIADWVIGKATATDPKISRELFLDFKNFDAKRALSAVHVPIRAVNASPPIVPATAIEINRKYADFDAVQVEGVGHFLMLEKPQVFNARLRDLLAAFPSRP
jgi:sigma-B regulation protein RsbQ